MTEDSYSDELCEVCEQQGAVVNLTPQSEYPNYNPNNTLAHIIVKAWRDPNGFGTDLLANPDQALRAEGLFLVNPRVMTHTQYKAQIVLEKKVLHEGTMVLVLPDAPSPLPPPEIDLLDSARAAMAYTPVGI
jgi:hypothetical protein